MTIDDLSKLAGVLGFFISLATFGLTRWERRIVLDFGLDEGTSHSFESEYNQQPVSEEARSTVNLTLTNRGQRAALLDMRTLEVCSERSTLHAWKEDFWGKQDREVLLKPDESHTIGIPLPTFLKGLKIETPKKYDEETLNLMYPVSVRVKTTSGRSYTSKGLQFWEATGEFHRNA